MIFLYTGANASTVECISVIRLCIYVMRTFLCCFYLFLLFCDVYQRFGGVKGSTDQRNDILNRIYMTKWNINVNLIILRDIFTIEIQTVPPTTRPYNWIIMLRSGRLKYNLSFQELSGTCLFATSDTCLFSLSFTKHAWYSRRFSAAWRDIFEIPGSLSGKRFEK